MDEDELDPRIQVELEKLNTATDEINKLEIELDEANTTFRMLLNECTRRLKVHSSKFGSAIVSARPYYEALDVARMAQQECQRAAVSFQRANEVHEAAKETVALAETRFLSQQPEWRFDSAWQEMLNHATLKVRDAEKQRAESAAYHGQATARYKQAQDKVQQLDQRLRRNVAKSRPYFEEKARCNDQLAAQKSVVEALQNHVSKVKMDYADSLRRLEGISEEIHRKRANMLAACSGVREPGVGAELEYEGELKDLENLRRSLDAHHASRSPDGDAKTAQPPGTSHLNAKPDGSLPTSSGDVYDHFVGLEERAGTNDSDYPQVPELSRSEDFVAQSSSETKHGDLGGDGDGVNELARQESRADIGETDAKSIDEERRLSKVEGELSIEIDSVISRGAATTDADVVSVSEKTEESSTILEDTNLEGQSNKVESPRIPPDSKNNSSEESSNIEQKDPVNLNAKELRDMQKCSNVIPIDLPSAVAENKDLSSIEHGEYTSEELNNCDINTPTNKTVTTSELTQDCQNKNLTATCKTESLEEDSFAGAQNVNSGENKTTNLEQ